MPARARDRTLVIGRGSLGRSGNGQDDPGAVTGLDDQGGKKRTRL